MPVSDLSAHLGYWLRYVSNHVSLSFAQKLADRDVTVAEWALMRTLYDVEAAAPSVLASRMGLSRGAITKLADRLISKGKMSRSADPQDGRAQTLALTAAGRDLLPELAALADINDAEFFDHLSKAERIFLEQILKGIIERQGLTSIPVD